MPRNESVGPNSFAFRGVVVDDVEDHLDSGVVKLLRPGALNSVSVSPAM